MEANNTDFTKTAQYIAELGEKVAKAEYDAKNEPTVVDLYSSKYHYYNGRFTEISQPALPREYYPRCFSPFTSDGLIDWIKADTDKLFSAENPPALVVVDSPTRVSVTSHAQGASKDRITYAQCEYNAPRISYDQYMDSESMFVAIQTCFEPDSNRDIVLKIVNNLTEEQSMQTSDDGISQRVNIKSGVAAIDKTIFKNPAYLRPMRTFTEVAQPMSPFVVRFKEGKQAALFQADGGKWKMEAVRNIGNYLKEKLADQNVVVIA